MQNRIAKLFPLALLALVGISFLPPLGRAQKSGAMFAPNIPKTWDEQRLASLELPLASTGRSPEHIPADYYYRIPARAIYKSYPIYAPGREPRGYLEKLKQLEPEIVFDPARLKTEADWVRAGALVFEAPFAYDDNPFFAVLTAAEVGDAKWYQQVGAPVTKDGVLPFARYVIRKKGVIEIGNLSCAMCHTRVMPNGAVIKGAQGNFPFDWNNARLLRTRISLEEERAGQRMLFGQPWLRPDPLARIEQMSLEEIAAVYEAIPPGALARHGTSTFSPVQVPDLIGVKDRRYLDRTGLVRHREIGDLMRYGALNQAADLLSRHGAFRPIELSFGKLPEPAQLERFSDEQLYALARYLYALRPPPNPNKFDALAWRGQKVFQREGCAGCHSPPLYTNNKLTPAPGFQIPAEHKQKYDILSLSVGTDPNLALKTRRSTGYYKVPSLKGVWYRGPFEHNGSVATLEAWFDPNRLKDDYVPTGFIGYGIKTRAVRGHEFGLQLSAEDKRALIAFLKTL